jgi:hypothetical protein
LTHNYYFNLAQYKPKCKGVRIIFGQGRKWRWVRIVHSFGGRMTLILGILVHGFEKSFCCVSSQSLTFTTTRISRMNLLSEMKEKMGVSKVSINIFKTRWNFNVFHMEPNDWIYSCWFIFFPETSVD